MCYLVNIFIFLIDGFGGIIKARLGNSLGKIWFNLVKIIWGYWWENFWENSHEKGGGVGQNNHKDKTK